MKNFLQLNQLRLIDVPSDGNCGYYMYCMFLGWDFSHVNEMRRTLGEYMENQRSIFKTIVPPSKYNLLLLLILMKVLA